MEWGDLDYLVIDLPPGTGDAALSLSQLIPLTGAVIVTTPQEVSLLDARKAIAMFSEGERPHARRDREHEGLHLPRLRHEHDIFGSGGGAKFARELELDVLGRIPLEPGVRAGGDAGVPITSPSTPAARTRPRPGACGRSRAPMAGRVSVLAAPARSASSRLA